ncbi:MAG: alpha/beta hydrolase family protein [Acidimicrobiales bacterium]
MTEVTVPLVDHGRPTVAHGRQISPYRALTTKVWVPEAPGRRPLVVFVAGFEVGPTPYQALLESWARRGYVVAAPELPLTDAAVAGANLDEGDLANQPADIRFVTDALVAQGSPVARRIDRARVAVTGHSDGAETALVDSIRPAPPGEPAYRAVIAISAQPLTGPASIPNPPMLVIQGSADTINPPAHGYRLWEEAAPPKYFEVLYGAGHLPPLEAGSSWLPVVEAVTGAFLDAYVAGDAKPAGLALAGDAPPLASIYGA